MTLFTIANLIIPLASITRVVRCLRYIESLEWALSLQVCLLIYVRSERDFFPFTSCGVIYIARNAHRTTRLLFLSFSLSFFLISLITVADCNSKYHYCEVFYHCSMTSVTSLGSIVSYFYAELVDLISLARNADIDCACTLQSLVVIHVSLLASVVNSTI